MLRAALQVSEVCKPPEGVGEEETLSIEEKLRRGASERHSQFHSIWPHLFQSKSPKLCRFRVKTWQKQQPNAKKCAVRTR